MLNAWYFTIITLTTVGFGDYVPAFQQGDIDNSAWLNFFLEIYRTIGNSLKIMKMYPKIIISRIGKSSNVDACWSCLAWWLDIDDLRVIGRGYELSPSRARFPSVRIPGFMFYIVFPADAPLR